MSKILMLQFHTILNLGMAYICGAVRAAGHQFHLVIYENREVEAILTEIKNFQPDVIGFTCMTGVHTVALNLAGQLKKRGVTIPMIFGGPHPTIFPDSMICHQAVDGLSLGEGELSLVELLNGLTGIKDSSITQVGWPLGKPDCVPAYFNLPGFWFKTVKDGQVYIVKNELAPLSQLDELPPCDWGCYEGNLALRTAAPVTIPIRGCPYKCSYCSNHSLQALFKGKGPYVRHHSPQRAIEEIKRSVAAFPTEGNTLKIWSETMGLDLKWSREFFDLYKKEVDKPFLIFLRPELVTPEFVGIIAQQRCHSVAMGVESGSERVRREVFNRKHSNELLLEAAQCLHKAGILFRGFNIIAVPTETEEEIWETIGLNIKMKTDFPTAGLFMPLPGTQLANMAVNLGYMDEEELDNFPANSLMPLSTMLKRKFDVNRIQMYLYMFQTAVLFPWLHPIIRKLINFKPNWLFRVWFQLVSVFVHRKSEGRSYYKYFIYIWANRKNI